MKTHTPYIVSVNSRHDAPYSLYCFSYAGGSGQNFYSWNRLLPECIDHRVVNLPGRGKRFHETPLESISAMADEIVRDILRCPNQKILFYGHSMGAAVAYESAKRLEKHGVHIDHLFVGAFRAPNISSTNGKISHLPQEEFLNRVSAYGSDGIELLLSEPDLAELLLPMLRADFKAAENYHNDLTPLSSPITAFYGTKDTMTLAHHVEEWEKFTSSYFSAIPFQTSHFFQESHAHEIISTIANTINTIYCHEQSA